MRSTAGRLRSGAAAFGAAALLLAACGHSSSTTSPSHAPQSNATSIGTDRIQGIGTVLDTAQGLTLYHNTAEAGGRIVCTGSCAKVWPPVLVSGVPPQGSPVIKGAFGSMKRPDGTTQLTFDGMPLYTFSGDSSPGQANGQGLQGVWFAVTASGAKTSGSNAGGSASGGSSSGSSRGYSYGSSGGSSSSSGSSSGSGW